MRWKRFTRPDPLPHTPRRLAAARRAVDRDRQDNALTPELARFYTAEDRLAHYDRETAAFWKRLRDTRAANWREARRALRALPPTARRHALTWWNNWQGPADPEHLLGRIRDWHARARLFATDAANLHRLRLHMPVNNSLDQSPRVDPFKGADHVNRVFVTALARLTRRARQHGIPA